MHCDTCGSVSYIAPQGGIIVLRPRWSSRFGEPCTTVNHKTESSRLDSPLHAEQTGNFTLPDRCLDILRGQCEFECLKGVSVGQERGRGTQTYLRVPLDEQVGHVDLFQSVTYSKKVNTSPSPREREWTIPDAPGGVHEIRTRICGAININRPTERQNHAPPRKKCMHVPKETTNFSFPQSWYINMPRHLLVKIERRYIVRIVHPNQFR